MKKTLVLLVIASFFLACKQNKNAKNDNLFRYKEYIFETTSGLVSIADPIEIHLAKDITKYEVDTEINSGDIKINPKVKGKFVVKDKRQVLLMPEENLQPDTEYTVKIALNKLMDHVPSSYRKYQFQFKTIKPNFSLNINNLQSYSKDWQYLTGQITTSDVTDFEKIKKVVQATQNKKPLSVKWQEINSMRISFTIDSIQRFEDDAHINISWNGKEIDVPENKGNEDFLIPGKNNFSVVQVKVIQNPEQHLEVNFSDPLKQRQNFSGLVQLQSAGKLRYTVEGNLLKIYPENRLTGNIHTEIFTGIKSADGYQLKQKYEENIAFEQFKPAVRLLNKGSILPNSNELNFNFEAVNLKSVTLRVIKIYEDNILQFLQSNQLNSNNAYSIRQVGRRVAKKKINLLDEGSMNTGNWKAYAIDLSKIIQVDPGAIYRLELSFDINDAAYDCDASAQTNEDNYEEDYYYDEYDDYSNYNNEIAEDEEEREEQYWDNVIYDYKRYNYNWSERNNPCHPAYYNEDRMLAVNILASNLGVIVKRGNNLSYNFTVTDITSTQPITGAKITLYNFQQQEIVQLKTNNEGMAMYKTDKRAYFAIVSRGVEKTYITLDDGHALSLSKFDVAGSKAPKGLKGYLYGERGVWRPGDTLHLTFVLNDKDNPIPEGHPIKFEITDARGQLVDKQLTSFSKDRFYNFNVITNKEAPTGNWRAKVSVGGATFNKTLRVATVKPNRLKINLHLGEQEILSTAKPINAKLSIQWLHGAPAKNVKADIQMKLTNATSYFDKYPNYLFTNPLNKYNGEEINIYEGNVNDNGTRNFTANFKNINTAAGMMQAHFFTRAFEPGGDFSMDVTSKKVSPYRYYVGINAPDTDLYGSYTTDKNYTFDVISLSEEGKAVARKNLKLRVYKINWRWWYSSSYEDLASYVSSSYHEEIYDQNISTNAQGKAIFNLNIPDKKGGRYLILLEDTKSGHKTGMTTYFYKDWWRSPQAKDDQSANMLLFATDKEKYQVGETAHITFPSSVGGRALVSIENASQVVEQRWVKTEKGETKLQLPLTAAMAPNVFINVSLLQPHASTANDLPLRMYGIIPIMVEDPSTKLTPQIEMPDVLKPETDFTVKVSEKSGKAMTYTLAVVDEGLLDLTRFKTPDLWEEFNKKQALGVKTWDIFDEVIGAYAGSVDKVFAIGGDEEAFSKKGKKAQRFKPVVTYLGPFRLEKGKTDKHQIHMPNYVGAVRTMLIAGDNSSNAYGSSEKSTPVRKPLMLLTSVPRKLSPGEQISLPVTVFAMEKHVKNIQVQVKTSEGIKVQGASIQNLTFENPDEKMLIFDLDVKDAKGVEQIEVIASGNGEKASYKVEIDVINPNPVTQKTIEAEISANSSQEISFDTFGEAGSNMAKIEVSTLPPMDFDRRIEYLIRYPYGCLEQTTSAVFPQLYMPDIFDLTAQHKQEIDENIKEGIKKIGRYQLSNGGLSYWVGLTSASDWATSYAGHFMLEAEKKGYALPLTFKTNWLRYQKEAARSWRPSYRSFNTHLAQAYRLYTLALAGEPELAAMNRLRENKEISNDAKWRLAAAYALSGQKEAAKKIAHTANINFVPQKYDYYTYGNVDRNRAMAMESMLLVDDKSYVDLSKDIAKTLSSQRWLSTQTTAMSLLAMSKMLEKGGGKDLNVKYTIANTTDKIKTNKSIANRTLAGKDGHNSLQVENKTDHLIYVRIFNSGKLPVGKEVSVENNLDLNIKFEDEESNIMDISNLHQGTDFTAVISVKNKTVNYVDNIALTQLFPGGWEIINTSFTAYGGVTDEADFTDIRDDRVNFYFNLGSYKTKTFKVRLNAAYLGKYYLFGSQAEAMYDRDYLTRTQGKWVKVVK